MKIKLFFVGIFVSALFLGILPNICYGSPADGNLLLKNIYVSKNKNSGSYLIWFKFNQKPKGIVKKIGLKGYSLELAFKNAQSGISSRFIKFHNSRLFKAVEIIPVKNSGLNATIYFHKNIKIAQKNTYATFYGSYFIIKINHTFYGDLFKNVGKESSPKNVKAVVPAASTVAAGMAKASKNNLQDNPSFLGKNAPKLNMGFEAVKTAVYLALVVGLIYGIYFLMNKFKNRVSVKEKLNNLKIVSSINLGNKKSILLIEVNTEFFLVGVSQSNIQVIGHLKGDAGNVKDAPSYGKFADVMREQVNNHGGGINESYRKIRAEQYNMPDTNMAGKPGTFKVKNINEAKFKNKADNVFFDIEERLKGLMESNGNDFTRSEASNSKKF